MNACRPVPPDPLPAGRDHFAVAQVAADFDAVLGAIGAQATRVHRPRESGAYRYAVLEFPGGRHAVLLQHEKYPEHFSIQLQPIRDIAYRRAEFDAVCALIAVPASQITVLTGQVRWK